MINILHITNNINNISETFIRDFLIELSKRSDVNLKIFQKENINITDNLKLSELNLYQFKEKSIFQKVKEKYFNKRNTLFEELYFIGISKSYVEQANFVFVDYGLTATNLLQNTKYLNIPLFVFLHGFDVSKAFRNDNYIKQFNIISRFDNIKFVSPCKYFINKIVINFNVEANKLILSPYGVEKATRTNISSNDEIIQYKLLFVGRLVAKKNPLALVEVIDILIKKYNVTNLVLTIIGDGPLMREIKNRIIDKNLGNYIEILGSRNHDFVKDELLKSHIYVQHSVTDFDGDQEGLPNSILEALAAGLPVVSTIHSGIPEIVKHEFTGFLVQEFDVDQMAKIIERLIRDKSLYKKMRNNILEDRNLILNTTEKRVDSLLANIRETCLNF